GGIPPRDGARRHLRARRRRPARGHRDPHRGRLPERRRDRRAAAARGRVTRVAALALAALAVGVAGCDRGSAAQAPTATGPDPITVTVANVAMRPVERTVTVVGTLAANAQAEIASEVDGQVVAIEADLGDRVARDQVLAR